VIYRVFRVLMSRHLMIHLIVPLIIGLGLELAVIEYHANFPGWWELAKEKVTLIVGVVAAYLLISTFLVYKETNRQVERSQLDELEKVLPSANAIFATCALRLKDWFEPSIQVYFSKLLGKNLEGKNFRHQRVLLFFHNGEIKDCQSPFIDGHWANAMIAIHETFGIDLAVLRRRDIHQILGKLTTDEKKLLGFYPRWLNRGPKLLLDISLRLRRRIPEMDFAFITHPQTGPTVLPFSQKGESLKVANEKSVLVYEKLMNLIKEKIYEPNEPQRLRANFDFRNKIGQL
jgi:hypothetical protein